MSNVISYNLGIIRIVQEYFQLALWVAVLKKEVRELLRADCSKEPDEQRR